MPIDERLGMDLAVRVATGAYRWMSDPQMELGLTLGFFFYPPAAVRAPRPEPSKTRVGGVVYEPGPAAEAGDAED